MSTFGETLGQALVWILFLSVLTFLSGVLVRIKNRLRGLLLGFDVQKLLQQRDEPGLLLALAHKRKDSDSLVNYTRSNAAIALGEVGGPGAIRHLLVALGDDERVVQAAGQAIAQITLRCYRQPLQDAVAGRKEKEATALLSALARVQSQSSAPLLAAGRRFPSSRTLLSAMGLVGAPELALRLGEIVLGQQPLEVRTTALSALASAGDPRLGDVLLRLLQDPATELRRRAVELLGLLRARGAAPLIAALLRDEDADVRKAAIASLMAVGHPVTPVFLSEALGKETVPELEQAILAALEQTGSAALDRLHEKLGRTHAGVRVAAARALAKFGEPQWSGLIKGEDQDLRRLGESRAPFAPPLLLAATRTGEPEGARSCAVTGLSRSGDPQVIEALIALTKDPGALVSRTAVEALAERGCQAGVQQARVQLVHPTPENRMAAVRALAAVGEPQWVAWVKGDGDDLLRLGRSGEPLTLDLLRAALDRDEAVTAIALSRSPQAEEILVGLVKTDHSRRIAAIGALAEFKSASALEAVATCLSNEAPGVRRAAIASLGRMGDRRATPHLAKLLEEPDFPAETVEALATLLDPDAQPALESAFSDPRAEVRTAAAKGLAALGIDRWNAVIQGDRDDLLRVAESGLSGAYPILSSALRKARSAGDLAGAVFGLGKLADPRAIPLLRPLLLDDLTELRTAAAEALAGMSEPQWRECLKRDRGSPLSLDALLNLASAGLEEATDKLIGELTAPGRARRVTAARMLIQLASRPDRVLRSAWTRMAALINQPHTDVHSEENRSSDCSHSDHTDVGIGLSFPLRHDG